MRKLYFLRYALAVTATLYIAGCGSGTKTASDETTEVVVVTHEKEKTDDLPTDRRKMSVVADSLALYADDLTPQQALTVLSTFYRVHVDARANGERRKDIQTMRKFIDVYEIVMSNHRDELRKLMLRAYEADSTLNLPGAIGEFRALLDDYDSAHGQGSEYVVARQEDAASPTDEESVKLEPIESASSIGLVEEPLEFRPAK